MEPGATGRNAAVGGLYFLTLPLWLPFLPFAIAIAIWKHSPSHADHHSMDARETPAADTDEQWSETVRAELNWEFDRVDEQPYDHYTTAIEDIKQLKRDHKHDEVEELLLWCIAYAEAESEAKDYLALPPRYYKDLAIVYRKDDRCEEEIEILERYIDACEAIGDTPRDALVDRLDRARELAELAD